MIRAHVHDEGSKYRRPSRRSPDRSTYSALLIIQSCVARFVRSRECSPNGGVVNFWPKMESRERLQLLLSAPRIDVPAVRAAIADGALLAPLDDARGPAGSERDGTGVGGGRSAGPNPSKI